MTDNHTFISAHPHNGHNISNLRCMKFAVLNVAALWNLITFACPHRVSQIFFANEACSSSFSFADRRNAFDFMISVMSFCASACSDRVSAFVVMDTMAHWTVFCLFSSAVISPDSTFRFTPLADFARCRSRYSVYFWWPLAAADRSQQRGHPNHQCATSDHGWSSARWITAPSGSLPWPDGW